MSSQLASKNFLLADRSLAINGGAPAVSAPHPHEPWPPQPESRELQELATQRERDISIKGRSGPIAALEDDFRQLIGDDAKYCVSFNSGTSALLAAYFALGIGDGDEVIGPALTYHAALSPLFTLRASPVLADIDRATRCLDPAEIDRLVTPKTRAVTVVHQWGHPADMDRILAAAHRHGLRVIEDCSHAHGSRYRGRMCGTFGDVAVFSLQAAKMIFAGEGGLLVTRHADIHDRATLLGHYRDRSRDEVIDESLRRFWVTGFGLKLRMSPLNAVTARHAISAFPTRKQGRHACLQYLLQQLEQFDFIEPHAPRGDVDMGAWYGFKPLYLPERLGHVPRDVFIQALQAEGVEIDVPSAPCLDELPLYHSAIDPLFGHARAVMGKRSELAVARFVAGHAISLPTFYRWPEDRHVIDQYVLAFQKVAAAVAGRC